MHLSWNAERAVPLPFLQPFDHRTTTIAAEAREVRCSRQGLEGATYSDHGFVIIGMYFAPGRDAQEGSDYDSMCEKGPDVHINDQVAAVSIVPAATY